MNTYTITASGRKALEKNELGTQATLVLKAVAKKDNLSSAEVAEKIESTLETRQPATRVAGFYLAQFKADGLVKATKAPAKDKPAPAPKKKAAKKAKKSTPATEAQAAA